MLFLQLTSSRPPRGMTMLSCLLLILGLACSDDTTQGATDGGQSSADSKASTATYSSCFRQCTKTDECCPNPPCDKGEEAQACEKGLCKLVGCKTDKDCKPIATFKRTCKQVKVTATYSFGNCSVWCTADSDCTAPSKCVVEQAGTTGKMCGTPCKKDSDCTTNNSYCKDGKFCLPKAFSCQKDTDCAGIPGLDQCNTQAGRCECSTDKKCTDGMGGVLGGKWECKKAPF